MRHTKTFIVGCLLGLSACTPIVLAPGAAQVKVTNLPADVADCSAVGNLRVSPETSGMLDADRSVGELKNQAIGLGGNVALVTDGSPRFPVAGVAYRCPARSGT